MEEYEGTYIESRPAVAGLPHVWLFKTRLDSGEEKVVKVSYEEIQQCRDALQLKPGDRIKVRVNIKKKGDWEVTKLG